MVGSVLFCTVVQVAWLTSATSSPWVVDVVLTLVSLQSVQAFRLLLKTSVEGNVQEFSQFLVGFAICLSPGISVKELKTNELTLSMEVFV